MIIPSHFISFYFHPLRYTCSIGHHNILKNFYAIFTYIFIYLYYGFSPTCFDLKDHLQGDHSVTLRVKHQMVLQDKFYKVTFLYDYQRHIKAFWHPA
jgi:hypothetical protein